MRKIQEEWSKEEKERWGALSEQDRCIMNLLEVSTRVAISKAAIKQRIVAPEYLQPPKRNLQPNEQKIQKNEEIGYQWAHDGVKVFIPDLPSLLKDFVRPTRKDADDRSFYFGNDLIVEGDAEKKDDKKSYQIRDRNRTINLSKQIIFDDNALKITPEEDEKCLRIYEKYKKRFLKQTTIAPLQDLNGKEEKEDDLLKFIRVRTKKLVPPGT